MKNFKKLYSLKELYIKNLNNFKELYLKNKISKKTYLENYTILINKIDLINKKLLNLKNY